MDLQDGISTLYGFMFMFLGGLLKHIYSKFEKIDVKNETQDKEISIIESNVNVLISQKDDLREAVNELKVEMKAQNSILNQILIKIDKR